MTGAEAVPFATESDQFLIVTGFTLDSEKTVLQSLCYNHKMSKIICAVCKKEIASRKELAIVGRSFIPHHKKCFKKRRDVYAFYSGYPINSSATWWLLILINMALWATYLLFNAPFKEIFYMSIFSIILLLGFRLIAYFSYEIKLPHE